MKLGEFRRLTADLPDEADLLMELGDLYFLEMSHKQNLPPVLEHSYAVWLSAGQAVNYELDMDARVDAAFGM